MPAEPSLRSDGSSPGIGRFRVRACARPGMSRAVHQNPGSVGSSRPPVRTGAIRSASPVASSVSTATPLSVADAAAPARIVPDGMPDVKRRNGSSFCMPMIES